VWVSAAGLRGDYGHRESARRRLEQKLAKGLAITPTARAVLDLFARAFKRVGVQPFRVFEKSAKGPCNLPVLVPGNAGRKRSGIEQDVSSQPDQLRFGIERRIVRLIRRQFASDERHCSHLYQSPGEGR
jgi:hypothetical protein